MPIDQDDLPPITGQPGELFERLAVGARWSDEPEWLEAFQVMATVSVGGALTFRLDPLPLDEFLNQLRSRISELVESGVSEPFIIGAVWTAFREHIMRLADTGPSEQFRMNYRSELLSELDDPVLDPERREVVEQMLEGPYLQPTGPEHRAGVVRRSELMRELDEVLLTLDVREAWIVRSLGGIPER
jgi:hypothetical protein